MEQIYFNMFLGKTKKEILFELHIQYYYQLDYPLNLLSI